MLNQIKRILQIKDIFQHVLWLPISSPVFLLFNYKGKNYISSLSYIYIYHLIVWVVTYVSFSFKCVDFS